MSNLNVSAANLAAAKDVVVIHQLKRAVVRLPADEKTRASQLAKVITKLHLQETGRKPAILVSVDETDTASKRAARKFATSRKSGYVITHDILKVAKYTPVYSCPAAMTEIEIASGKRYGWAQKSIWPQLEAKACFKRMQKLGLANRGKRRIKFSAEQHNERAAALLEWAKGQPKPGVDDPLYAMIYTYMNPNHALYRPGFERTLRRITRGRWKFNASSLREVA